MINQRLLLSAVFVMMMVNSVFAQLNTSNLYNNWILIESVWNNKKDISNQFSGYLRAYNEETCILRNVFNEFSTYEEFKLKDSLILYKDTIEEKIISLTYDSLKIVLGNRENTFVSLKKKSMGDKLTIDYLSENNWVYVLDTIQGRIDFQNKAFRNSNSETEKQCVSHFKSGMYNYLNIERWSLIDFNDNTFLNLTINEHWVRIHQVLSVEDDTIKLCTWGGEKFVYPVLVKQSKLKLENRNNIIKILTSKQWNASCVFDYSTEHYNYRKDSLGDVDVSGAWGTDTLLIDKKDFLNKKMSFKLHNDMRFEILIKNKIFSSGDWDLSFDGKYIVLNDGNTISDYIEVINLSNNILQIGKYDMFHVGKHNAYVGYYYKMIMN